MRNVVVLAVVWGFLCSGAVAKEKDPCKGVPIKIDDFGRSKVEGTWFGSPLYRIERGASGGWSVMILAAATGAVNTNVPAGSELEVAFDGAALQRFKTEGDVFATPMAFQGGVWTNWEIKVSLTDEEFAMFRSHAPINARLIDPAMSMLRFNVLKSYGDDIQRGVGCAITRL